MKKFVYTFTSTELCYEDWTWELASVLPDWMSPTLTARRGSGEDARVYFILHARPDGWPSYLEWIDQPQSIDDAYRTMASIQKHGGTVQCPADVVAAVLEKISEIRAELDQANAALRAVVADMKDQLRGLDTPLLRCIPALSPFPSVALPQAFKAAHLLALEASSIQHNLNRLASAPALRSAVAGALSALPGHYLDDAAFKARSAAMQAAAECGAFGPDPGSASAIADFLASQKVEKPSVPDELLRSRCCSKCGHRE